MRCESLLPFSGAPAVLDPPVEEAVVGVASTLEGLVHEVELIEAPYGLAPGLSIMPRSMARIRAWARRARRTAPSSTPAPARPCVSAGLCGRFFLYRA